uniref:Uncharacterized protein n=1 Tax=Castor canadensis TaxID=51338 RepID=A0A8C0XTA3_CASCN
MSRLLPLLGSRTARSLRPGPAAAPRPPSWCCCGRGPLALATPGGPRRLGTHPKKEPMEALNTAQGARDFIYSLHSTERSCLLKELHRFESIAIAQVEIKLSARTTSSEVLTGAEISISMNTRSHGWLELSLCSV